MIHTVKHHSSKPGTNCYIIDGKWRVGSCSWWVGCGRNGQVFMDLDLNLTLTDLQFYSKDFKFMKFYPVILLHMVCIVSDIYWGYAGICTMCTALLSQRNYTGVFYSCASCSSARLRCLSDFSSEKWDLTWTYVVLAERTNNAFLAVLRFQLRISTIRWLAQSLNHWLSTAHMTIASNTPPNHLLDYFVWIFTKKEKKENSS